MSEFLAAFGLTLDEYDQAVRATAAYLNDPRTHLALLELASAAPDIAQGSRDQLNSAAFKLLSEAGRALLVGTVRDKPASIASFDGYQRRLMADPVLVRDLSIWALFFACREASDILQIDDCIEPWSESHLTGQLLGALGGACEKWRKTVDAPLDRYGSELVLEKLDLSILGGEQVTGGDFGLIVDLDGASVQPGEGDLHVQRGRRIVPFIFQAKRYLRPFADVSQHHWARGYQRDLLARNDCASAYILYENGTVSLTRALPPIIKPVDAVSDVKRTLALSDGYDLASYLVSRVADASLAPGADTPDEALRMIYAKGRPARLAVIASDRLRALTYQARFDELARELHRGKGDEGIMITT